ncbi:hypothetical protein BH10BDE1_BH10BDE1_19540 [soil metagenome]
MTKRISMMLALGFMSAVSSAALSSSAFSSTVNLNPGESVLIQPNTSTTVICGNGPAVADCTRAISVYDSRYKACKNGSSSSICFNNEWSAFKLRSPECVVEAFDSCYRTCVESMSSSICYNNCR